MEFRSPMMEFGAPFSIRAGFWLSLPASAPTLRTGRAGPTTSTTYWSLRTAEFITPIPKPKNQKRGNQRGLSAERPKQRSGWPKSHYRAREASRSMNLAKRYDRRKKVEDTLPTAPPPPTTTTIR